MSNYSYNTIHFLVMISYLWGITLSNFLNLLWSAKLQLVGVYMDKFLKSDLVMLGLNLYKGTGSIKDYLN